MASVRRNKLHLLAFLVALLPATPAHALKQSTLTDYTTHLRSLHTLILSCQANASACDPTLVGSDEQIALQSLGSGANVNQFEAHYDWLRSALKQAHDPAYKNRNTDLIEAAVHIDDALHDVSTPALPSFSFAQARRRADSVLGHPEFVTIEAQSVWQRLIARFFLWLDGLFSNVAKFGERSPWIGPLIEWGLITLALTGLVLWAIRTVQRQRLAVQLESARQLEPWEEASRNWRKLAEEQAEAHEWREAVHCLYWATIVMLEGRRYWTPNRSRTPREYVRLLESGSTRWTLLRKQTLGFERIWYGLNAAAQNDYQSALELHEQLRVT
jgi:hypothetical protein